MSIKKCWTELDIFTDIVAAFLWLDMEPEAEKFPICVEEVNYELNTNVKKIYVVNGLSKSLKNQILSLKNLELRDMKN